MSGLGYSGGRIIKIGIEVSLVNESIHCLPNW